MSSITAADLKLGGRLVAACDAIGASHLRKAAGIFAEIADDLNQEAEATTGLLAPAEDDWAAPLPGKIYGQSPAMQVLPVLAELKAVALVDLQMCARNVHSWGLPDPVSGWRTCSACGSVNVAPPGGGPIDIGARQ